MNSSDLLNLYRQMYRSRTFEEMVIQFWNDGLISGEMHTSIGEEAIYAGIISQLKDGDALALDHRGTSPAILRGVDPTKLLLEFLGHPQGLSGGLGGHMHIFSKDHLLASSGIVGASGPAAVGFALSATQLRPGCISVAFFGEGALNQGMLMEAMNLSSSLQLPVLFVCKDNGMSITTSSSSVTAGTPLDRARGFAIQAEELDGSDIEAVHHAANYAIQRARNGNGPFFIHAHCWRPQGHFLGDPLLRILKKPVKELRQLSGPLLKSTIQLHGASLGERVHSLKNVMGILKDTAKNRYSKKDDPLAILRMKLGDEKKEVETIESQVNDEIKALASKARQMISHETR